MIDGAQNAQQADDLPAAAAKPSTDKKGEAGKDGLVNGHTAFVVNGVAIDPTVVQGLCAYHLGKQYKKKPVLRDVSVGVLRGEAVGLLGLYCACNTTCFYIITGLIKADAGAIFLDGSEVTDQPMFERARGGIGYLPQEASIFRGMSVEDNIMAVLEVVDNVAASRAAGSAARRFLDRASPQGAGRSAVRR